MCISICGPPKSIKCYSAKKTHVLKQRNMMLMQLGVCDKARRQQNPCGPCADRTITLVELLPTSKHRKSAGRTSNGEEKEGSWARCTGKIHSLHTRTEKCQNFGEKTKWTSVKI